MFYENLRTKRLKRNKQGFYTLGDPVLDRLTKLMEILGYDKLPMILKT